MAGKHEGDIPDFGKLHRHVTGIGVMTVYYIRREFFFLGELDSLVDKFIEDEARAVLCGYIFSPWP